MTIYILLSVKSNYVLEADGRIKNRWDWILKGEKVRENTSFL